MPQTPDYLYDDEGELINEGIYYGVQGSELARTNLDGGLIVNRVALFSVCLQSSIRRRRSRDFTYTRHVYQYFPGATQKELNSVRRALSSLQEVGLIQLAGSKITVLQRRTEDARPCFPKYTTAMEALAGLEPIDEPFEYVRPVPYRESHDVRQFNFGL